MIPDDLIDKANHAYITSRTRQAFEAETITPLLWSNRIPPPPNSKTSMRHALEAVAADIWEQGYEAGADDEWVAERGKSPSTPNPYREVQQPQSFADRLGARSIASFIARHQ